MLGLGKKKTPPPSGQDQEPAAQSLGKIVPAQVPADQAIPGQPGAPGKPHKGADGNDFEKMQKNWSKQKVDMAQANLLSLFDTDDDMPLSKHLLLVAISSFFLVFVLWANTATLDEIARGDGSIIPSSDTQIVSTLDAGIVQALLVYEGQLVEKGQVLMRLSDIEASSDLSANEARFWGLQASIIRLQAEAEGKTIVEFAEGISRKVPQNVTEELNTFRANQQSLLSQTSILQQQLSQRQQEVRGLQTRVNDAQSSMSLIRDERAMIAPLVARGTAPRMELLQLDQRINEKKAEQNSAQSSLRQARGAVNEVNARIREIKTSARAQAQSELSVKQIESGELKERLSALSNRKSRRELVSPVKGTIQEIAVKTIGTGVVNPGQEIIKIVPFDDQLIVEARIKPSDRAFVYPTQKAVVKITAYDFSIYGGLDAKVIDISPETVKDEQGNSFYRVRIRTDKSAIKRKGEVLPIIVGMQASVDIITGKKTVMQYLLKPFIKTLNVALKER